MTEEDSKAMSSATNDSSDGSSESETELMVTARARRTTAGNRYNNVVAQEQAAEDEEDDVALLFAEIEGEDEEYHSDEGADDADMSSSDDDDQGPNAAPDDLDGEQAILQEAKAERAKKRKADLALTSISGLRKRPKIDPTALRRAPAPKPSKRKERVSWLPDQGFTAGRTSLRKQTIAHRAETHAKLKKNEQQRLKAKARRAQREKEREADAPKELTQADRLAEAERVERRNAKSLNRWEASEKKRQEEQAARLAALKDRKLSGAVISSISARHSFQGWRSKENPDGETGEVKKRGRKSKAYLEQLAAAKLLEASTTAETKSETSTPVQATNAESNADLLTRSTESEQPAIDSLQPLPSTEKQGELGASTPEAEPSQDPNEVTPDIQPLNAVTEPEVDVSIDESSATVNAEVKIEQVNAGLASTPQILEASVQEGKPSPADKIGTQNNSPNVEPVEEHKDDKRPDASNIDATNTADQIEVVNEPKPNAMMVDTTTSSIPESTAMETGTGIPPAGADVVAQSGNPDDLQTTTVQSTPAPEVVSIRNLIVLENLDSLSSHGREEYSLFFATKKTTTKPSKHTPELCLITGLPVRYRDPITGLGYHNATAFKKLKELRDHRFVWSSMLGCYAGASGLVARGVPEGFTG